METSKKFIVGPDDSGKRLDVFLTGRLPELTRSGVKRLLEEGRVAINGKPAKAGHKVRAGESVSAALPQKAPDTTAPEDISLEILYSDDDIIVVNKPYGLAVHPGAGRHSGTLVNALLFHAGRLSSLGGPLRPGIVHRLDKDTTGVLVAAKNDASHAKLARQFKEHTTGRRYIALVWGSLEKDEGSIDLPIGRDTVQRKKISTRTTKSRTAVTGYKTLKRYPQMTLVELKLLTGRTHQIRVHLAAINHPVVGDQVYGRRKPPSILPKPVLDALKKIHRQMLHAYTLGFTHPSTGEQMEFKAPLPPDMEGMIRLLETETEPVKS